MIILNLANFGSFWTHFDQFRAFIGQYFWRKSLVDEPLALISKLKKVKLFLKRSFLKLFLHVYKSQMFFPIWIIQCNLDLRKILGVDKIFLKSRFFLISNTRKPLKVTNKAQVCKMNTWNNANVLYSLLLIVMVNIFIP